jgi:NAD(P)-dependent dehydrogenase (short-subunit alcohol dehydrogenase family)
MNRVAGKVALITGGGAGIGAATGELICAEGGMAVLVDANAGALSGTVKAISQRVSGARVSGFAADVADPEEAVRAAEHALAAFGRLDILVNNAAMRNYSAIADSTPAEWQAIAGVNLVGVANYCKAALPALRRSGRGSIVNVSSCYALTGRKGMGLYDASKAGILAMTRTLACEEVAARRPRQRGLSRLDADRFPHLESRGRRQERRDAQDRAADHVAARALGDAAGDRLADSLARQRRSLLHHRGDARRRRRPFHHVTFNSARSATKSVSQRN